MLASLIVLVTFVLCISMVINNGHRYVQQMKERMVRTDLYKLHDAIAQFHTDTGRYPLALEELTALDAQHLHKPVKQGTYNGPYLVVLPSNPFAWQKGTTVSDPVVAHNWRYDPKTGQVFSAVPMPSH